jgi:hypothetical protein
MPQALDRLPTSQQACQTKVTCFTEREFVIRFRDYWAVTRPVVCWPNT